MSFTFIPCLDNDSLLDVRVFSRTNFAQMDHAYTQWQIICLGSRAIHSHEKMTLFVTSSSVSLRRRIQRSFHHCEGKKEETYVGGGIMIIREWQWWLETGINATAILQRFVIFTQQWMPPYCNFHINRAITVLEWKCTLGWCQIFPFNTEKSKRAEEWRSGGVEVRSDVKCHGHGVVFLCLPNVVNNVQDWFVFCPKFVSIISMAWLFMLPAITSAAISSQTVLQHKHLHLTLPHSAGPGAHLLQLQSPCTHHHCFNPLHNVVSGHLNCLADEASRRFKWSDGQILTHCPQPRPWQLCHLQPNMHSALTSCFWIQHYGKAIHCL